MDEYTRLTIERLEKGDSQALADYYSAQRERLWRMIQLRLDRRLYGRVDADDVLQEAFLEANTRVQHYLNDQSHSLFLWLRLIVLQTLAEVHRRHLGVQMRDAGREISWQQHSSQQTTSYSLAAQFLGHLTSPSQAAMREETAQQLQQALEDLEPIDREVLALRHFEELTNQEVAEVLNIQPKAASIRYIRALGRLKDILSRLPGFEGHE